MHMAHSFEFQGLNHFEARVALIRLSHYFGVWFLTDFLRFLIGSLGNRGYVENIKSVESVTVRSAQLRPY
jgi:hypothetical protein